MGKLEKQLERFYRLFGLIKSPEKNKIIKMVRKIIKDGEQ